MSNVDVNFIKVWRWEDAPLEFKDLSPHGGNEDWVAFVPDSIGKDSDGRIIRIPWLEYLSWYGSTHHEIAGGIVYTGEME
jgi:hypothetical protein